MLERNLHPIGWPFKISIVNVINITWGKVHNQVLLGSNSVRWPPPAAGPRDHVQLSSQQQGWEKPSSEDRPKSQAPDLGNWL